MRSIKFLVGVAALGALLVSSPSQGAEPTVLALGESIVWDGVAPSVLAAPPGAAPELCAAEAEGVLCTSHSITTSDAGVVDVRINSAGPNDWDVFVFDAEGGLVAKGFEVAEFDAGEGETYRVSVRPRVALPNAKFVGSATLAELPTA